MSQRKSVRKSINPSIPTRHVTRGAVVPILAALLVSSPAWATPLYWDLNGATANSGTTATGAWNGTNLFWNTSSTGTTGTPQATTSSSDDLSFSSGTGYTATNSVVTVTGAVSANSVTFEEGAVNVTGGTSITIGSGITQNSTASGTSQFSMPVVFSGATINIASNTTRALSITGAITSTGSSAISIGGSGSGLVTLSGGANSTVGNISTSGAVPVTLSTNTINNTGTITNNSSGAFILSGGVGSNVGDILLAGTGAQTLGTGAVNNNGFITNTGTGTNSISGILGGNVKGVIQNSSGNTLSLSGANTTFTTGITATAGTIRAVTSTAAFGTGTVTVGAAGIVDINNINVSTGLLKSSSSTASVTNSNATTRTLTISGTTSEVFAGSVSGNLNLTLNSGTQTLKGANTYTGATLVHGGSTLTFDTGSTVGGTSFSAANGSAVVGDGTIDLKGSAGISGNVSLGGINSTTFVATTGTLNQSGTLVAGGLLVADPTNSTGIYNLSGSATFSNQGRVASGGSGTAGSTGTVNQTGGSYTTSFAGGGQLSTFGVGTIDPAFIIGKNGAGTYNLSDGTFSLTSTAHSQAGILSIGTVSNGNTTSSAKFVQTGGSVSVQALTISPTGSPGWGGGTYEISGNSSLTTKTLNIAQFGNTVAAGQEQSLQIKGSGSTIQVTGTANYLSATDAFGPSGANLPASLVFFMNNNGRLEELINASTHSQIVVTEGSALFNTGSKVSLSLVDGFVPTTTTNYDLLTALTVNVTSGIETLLNNNGDTNWSLAIVSGGEGQILRATYTVVPEPASIATMLFAGMTLLRRRRK